MPTLDRPDPIAYLRLVADSAAGRAYKGAVLDALDVLDGHVVLDLGCGPGTDLGALADRAGRTGRVVAVDVDPVMVSTASDLTADRPTVAVRRGDVHALDLPAASVDRVHADRVLQHVEDPARAVAEVARVLRPGGVAALVEPDWALMAVDAHDLEASTAFTAHTCRHVVRNAHVGRQLPRLGVDAGLSVVSVQAFPAVFTDVEEADAVLGLTRTTRAAVAAGRLDASRSAAWLDDLATGPFTAVATVVATVLTRPVDD
ncbi:methyltransferase domain-containing protein [Kineococcus endophyticus]|uniref:Methyltransferase domain-containing protein n=1 Tax=Kineococcus endophyticus TaxID=1181883 RepID=A0ABV3P3U4_9ACTN